MFGARQRNPLVELPVGARAAQESVTHCLITHCQKGHFDHQDRAGTQWLRERQIPVICTPHDARYLRQRGLNVQVLLPEHEYPGPFLGGRIRTIRCTHGLGMIGCLMGHGVGFLIEMPGEPSLYLAGDTLLTDTVRACVREHRPAVSVVPAGGARFDLSGDIIMGIDEVIEFARLSGKAVVANHLEAISHCPVSRLALDEAATRAQVELLIPQDGEVLAF